MQMGSEPRLALVLCAETGMARAVHAIVERCGFAAVRRVASAAEALVIAQEVTPDVVVADLPSTGILGLGLVTSLRRVAPLSQVVVLSSFDTLRSAALDTGALELVASNDLRLLEACLRRMVGGDGAQDAGETSCSSETATGSRRMKAPSS